MQERVLRTTEERRQHGRKEKDGSFHSREDATGKHSSVGTGEMMPGGGGGGWVLRRADNKQTPGEGFPKY